MTGLTAQGWKKLLKKHWPHHKDDHNYPQMLYIIGEDIDDEYFKIGVATNLFQRLRALQQGNRRPLKCFWSASFPGLWKKEIKKIEDYAHEILSDKKLADITGETAGHDEWFKMTYEEALDAVQRASNEVSISTIHDCELFDLEEDLLFAA